MTMQPPILITGCARSGTSLVAGIVDKCGAWGGEVTGPTPHNRKGQFENTEIKNKIVKPFLFRSDCDPLGQKPLPSDLQICRWLNSSSDYKAIREKVLACIYRQGYKSGPWYYKGAKMCLMWPIWHRAFPDAKWIIVRRDPDQIARSCVKQGFMKAYATKEGWKEKWIPVHLNRFEEMKRTGLSVFEVWPENIVEGDFTYAHKMTDWLSLSFDIAEVANFITPKLWGRNG